MFKTKEIDVKNETSVAASDVLRVSFEELNLAHAVHRGEAASAKRELLQRKLEHLNRVIANRCNTDRLELMVCLLKLWTTGTDEGVRAEFSDCVKLRPAGRRAMLTLTGNGQQLRVWYSFPGRIDYDHIDSCGDGLLFGVYGYPELVGQYLNAFLGIANYAEARGKNGVRIFVGF